MLPHEVVRIIGKPEKMMLRLDDLVEIEYWAVPVIMRQDEEQYESAVTFETLEKAQKLSIGDVFLR